MARGPGDNAKTTSEEEPQVTMPSIPIRIIRWLTCNQQPKGGRKGTHKKITASLGKRAEQPEVIRHNTLLEDY